MKIEDYPPQDPLSEIGKLYHARVLELARNTAAEECSYGNDPYQAVAVFAAPEPNGNVLVFGHGGGWTTGYKEWMEFMAPALNAAGITFVSIGYRLAPEHVFPAGFEDWVSAVTWVHGNIAERGGNPDRIFLGGHSAGGHYASLLGVRRDWQEAAGLPRDVLRGCLPVSGAYDFEPEAGYSQRPRFLGAEGNERAASPLYNIQGTPPPFYIVHGEKDFPHLSVQARRMEEALRAAGGDVVREELPGLDHLGTSYASAEADGPWLPKVLNWMKGIRI